MKTTIRSMLILILLSALPAAAAFAQQGPEPMRFAAADADRPDDGGLPPEKREETRKKIESLRIWRLTEALKLDQNTSAKLASILSGLDQQRQNIQREQMDAMRSLRQALKEVKPDEAKLKAALEALERNHRAMQELRSREINDLKNVLTVEQQARFLVFQQEFMRELRGMIDDARNAGPGRGMGGGRMRGGAGGPPDR